jgi:hypothetical protein
MAEFNTEISKRRIMASIRELDKSDYNDICSLIKIYIPVANNNIISISARGTYINLDQIDEHLLKQLDNMVLTKLQRIHSEQV